MASDVTKPKPPYDMTGDLAAATLATARRVLRIESDALLMLAQELPADFLRVVDLILKTSGRVIFSGVGKSGHIARKIAATCSSTGTPSYFVHATEASHGDLGTITEADICVLLSNSGETSELSDIIAHTRRFSIPLVAMTSQAKSALSEASDFLLLLPPAPEACTIGMAPTTSTTLALALGDALAIALMDCRGFLPEHFRAFHPGGKLGARLAKVAQLMRGVKDLPLVTPQTPMTETILVMTEKGAGVAGLMADGRLIGIITDGDLRRHMDGLMTRLARDVATMPPLTVGPSMLAAEAVSLMNERKVQLLFVVDEDKRPLGMLHIHDCLRAGVV